MARKKKDPPPALPELDATRHKETRKNIPTEELRDFVTTDEAKPPKMAYPRDSSLEPQLVWKGKDDQDREPLEVDIVPIYIQEVIEPRVIVDAIQSRKTTGPDNGGFLPGFFDDFDALEFDHYSGLQKVDHSGHLHLLRLFPSQPVSIDLPGGPIIERGMGTLLIIEAEVPSEPPV
jgi:adenine-specific DNA-methyltransferase